MVNGAMNSTTEKSFGRDVDHWKVRVIVGDSTTLIVYSVFICRFAKRASYLRAGAGVGVWMQTDSLSPTVNERDLPVLAPEP